MLLDQCSVDEPALERQFLESLPCRSFEDFDTAMLPSAWNHYTPSGPDTTYNGRTQTSLVTLSHARTCVRNCFLRRRCQPGQPCGYSQSHVLINSRVFPARLLLPYNVHWSSKTLPALRVHPQWNSGTSIRSHPIG